MQILRAGSTGKSVSAWQFFLHGQGYYTEVVDGVFNRDTVAATIRFQTDAHLVADAVVGPKTLGAAMLRGFSAGVEDPSGARESLNWPPAPSFSSPSEATRKKLFGEFRYTILRGGGIKILDGWEDQNIVRVLIPELRHLAPGGILFHRAGADKLRALFKTWADAGLLGLIKSYDGAFVPRLIRGSATKLSNHAYGTAFDINCDFNALGAVPALVGKPGSVRELVPAANALGFYWGGHYKSRPDGMHFELAK